MIYKWEDIREEVRIERERWRSERDKWLKRGVEWREMARRYVVRSGKYRGMHYIFWDRQEWGEYLGDRLRRSGGRSCVRQGKRR